MSDALLQVEKIEVVYKRVITAVQGVTLSVGPKQIVAILGTNGAGKTTTLRAISGFLGTRRRPHHRRRDFVRGEADRERSAARHRRARYCAGARARQGLSQSDGR